MFEQQKQQQVQGGTSKPATVKDEAERTPAGGSDGIEAAANSPTEQSSTDAANVFIIELVHVCLSVVSENRHSLRMALLAIVMAMLYINLKLPPMLLVGLVMVIQVPDEEQIARWKALMREKIEKIKNSRLPRSAR